ncbi:DUF2846 domain-containing protein [Litchfieldella xinjiangensis]|uniref:DUF2846 domain-containing protein n=1 Tax=Litchfieldella xinjiangensis TaxID=1166948 RepID=UPI0018CCCEFF|nr:DUF2846 domain-containing protein [Halomonas xinjiangensis]
MQGELEGFSLPHEPAEDEALVYVVRPEITGTLVRFNVFVDDTDAESEVGYTRGSQHIYFPVEPGRHAIFSKAENWADIEIDVVAGEIVFLRQHAEMGLIMARNSLSRLSEDDGKYFVKETELGTLLNSN